MEMAKHIIFTKKDTAELLESKVRELKANEVKIKTGYLKKKRIWMMP